MPPMIQIRNLRKEYKDLVAVRNLSLDLDPSGRYAVVGGANQSIDVLRLP